MSHCKDEGTLCDHRSNSRYAKQLRDLNYMAVRNTILLALGRTRQQQHRNSVAKAAADGGDDAQPHQVRFRSVYIATEDCKLLHTFHASQLLT